MVFSAFPDRVISLHTKNQKSSRSKEESEAGQLHVYFAKDRCVTILYNPNLLSVLINKLFLVTRQNMKFLLSFKIQNRRSYSFIQRNIQVLKDLSDKLKLKAVSKSELLDISQLIREIKELEFAYALVWT